MQARPIDTRSSLQTFEKLRRKLERLEEEMKVMRSE